MIQWIFFREGPAFGNALAKKILNVFRVQLGLAKARYIYSGAAPLNPESHEFFASIGLPVMEVYGRSTSRIASELFVVVLICVCYKKGISSFSAGCLAQA